MAETSSSTLPDRIPINISAMLENFVLDSTKPVETSNTTALTKITPKTTAKPADSGKVNDSTASEEPSSLEDILTEDIKKALKNIGTNIVGKKTQPSQDDPNEDWCAVCHDGGDLLCCGKCPRVFHLLCHVPILNTTPREDWTCLLCTDVENCNVPEDAGGMKRKNVPGLCGRELLICERILLQLFCHESSPAFHEPISRSVPNYYKVISNPMDMATIRSKLSPNHFNHYKDVEGFLADVRLIFRNCCTFNQKESELYTAAKVLEEYFDEMLNKYFPEHAYDVTIGSQDSKDAVETENTEEEEVFPAKRQCKEGSDDNSS